MEPRLIVAYALIVLLVLCLAGVALRIRYTSHERTITRDRRRERDAAARRMADRERGES